MPMQFSEREQAFEAKFAHDEEFRFLTAGRRDKLFARWAASTLRMTANEEEALVTAVMAIPNGPGHDPALLQHIGSLLSPRDGSSERDLSAALKRCGQQARQQLIELPLHYFDAP